MTGGQIVVFVWTGTTLVVGMVACAARVLRYQTRQHRNSERGEGQWE
jgi:hypothetical protein